MEQDQTSQNQAVQSENSFSQNSSPVSFPTVEDVLDSNTNRTRG